MATAGPRPPTPPPGPTVPPPKPGRPAGPASPPPPPGPKKNTALAEPLLPVAEVAQLMRCSRQHVYDLIAARRLRAIPIGLRRPVMRVPASVVAAFIAAGGTSQRRSA